MNDLYLTDPDLERALSAVRRLGQVATPVPDAAVAELLTGSHLLNPRRRGLRAIGGAAAAFAIVVGGTGVAAATNSLPAPLQEGLARASSGLPVGFPAPDPRVAVAVDRAPTTVLLAPAAPATPWSPPFAGGLTSDPQPGAPADGDRPNAPRVQGGPIVPGGIDGDDRGGKTPDQAGKPAPDQRGRSEDHRQDGDKRPDPPGRPDNPGDNGKGHDKAHPGTPGHPGDKGEAGDPPGNGNGKAKGHKKAHPPKAHKPKPHKPKKAHPPKAHKPKKANPPKAHKPKVHKPKKAHPQPKQAPPRGPRAKQGKAGGNNGGQQGHGQQGNGPGSNNGAGSHNGGGPGGKG